jgi:hypothetical protein
LLRLVADELPNFNDVNVATAFNKLGKICSFRLFPRNIAADDSFRRLMLSARALCADGRLQAREFSNITHAVAKMSAAGKFGTGDAGVEDTLAALEKRVVLVAENMAPQGVSNTVYSFALLGRMPGTDARAVLEAALVRVAPGMKSQEVSNVMWATATLGLNLRAETWAALESAVVRVGPDMTPQAVATTLRSVLSPAATRGVPLPACYPSLWRAACGFEHRSVGPEDMKTMFHAQLIHTELVSGEMRDEVTLPLWIMHEAREAWMSNARDAVSVSHSVKEVANILGDLGIRHEVEHLTDDGYFSIDVYLSESDVALEFDGPAHFIITDGGEGVDPGDASGISTRTPTRTLSTETRDMFLARRHRVVLSVPWFEWAEFNGKGAAEKQAYVTAKLRSVGFSIPAST